MQTFLPYPDFAASAAVLDRQRLGKQRLEARQILNVLQGRSSGWRHHPAVLMWRWYDVALTEYGNIVILEWVRRGYANTMPLLPTTASYARPPWLGEPEFHLRHRSKLVQKNPDHYRPLFPGVPDDLDYLRPAPEVRYG